jgi:hypothetical protein
MRQVSFLAVGCVLLCGVSLVAAQEQAVMGPPKVLQIFREEVKPGKGPAHEKIEAAWARTFNKANYPAHYIAMTSVSGPSEAWFLEGHDSLASAERAEQFVEKNAALKGEVDQISQQDGELLSGGRSIIALYREEMSYRATGVNIGQMRYFYVTTVRVRPGHQDDFIEWNKIIRAAHEQANVPEHWAVFQVTLGMPAGTYLIFQPLKSLTEVDAFAQTHGKAYQDATGDEGRKKLRELASAGLLSSETNIFAFSSKMSYVSKETASADPDFWTPKPAVKAATVAKKEGKEAAPKP